ncbi:Pkinase-domain-containing protein [Gonapodya prolifera JEL478]|uniref:Pkinase-domain-containing protein n=1 Tax=Gonapodya prolifera (strain JEL478) TaxID=1344416 RepID=A0A139A009_GONPJ|nr:Pkinase-domain-containing protein [Gonapodya prolifera JEL478]|eukprot:KXS10116.1 Pkinase-domain-containing protein [Gonapodya prolifera JEL478]
MVPRPDDVPTNLQSLFNWGPLLGKGSFASVFLVTEAGDPSKEYAMKVIEKKLMRSSEDRKQLAREIEIMKTVDNAYCLKFYNVYESDSKVYIQMELSRGGELLNLVTKSSRAGLSEGMARAIVESVLRALAYLHSVNIVHRDLKLENVMLHNPVDYLDDDVEDLDWRRYEALADKIGGEVRLGDFGLAAVMHGNLLLRGEVGSFAYMSPEVLRGDAYNEKCDMWSVGVVAYLLLSGFFPFGAEEQPKAFRNIQAGKYYYPQEIWTYISPEARSFVDKLLVVDPSKRLSAEEALRDPWIASERTPRSLTPRPGSRRALSQARSEPRSVSSFSESLETPPPSPGRQVSQEREADQHPPAAGESKTAGENLAVPNTTVSPELKRHQENCKGVRKALEESLAEQRRFKHGLHGWLENLHDKLSGWDDRPAGAANLVEHPRWRKMWHSDDLIDQPHLTPLQVIRSTLFGTKKEQETDNDVAKAAA